MVAPHHQGPPSDHSGLSSDISVPTWGWASVDNLITEENELAIAARRLDVIRALIRDTSLGLPSPWRRRTKCRPTVEGKEQSGYSCKYVLVEVSRKTIDTA
jgi:hypothetical protein